MLTHHQSAAAVVRASRTGPTGRPSRRWRLLDGVRRRRPRRRRSSSGTGRGRGRRSGPSAGSRWSRRGRRPHPAAGRSAGSWPPARRTACPGGCSGRRSSRCPRTATSTSSAGAPRRCAARSARRSGAGSRSAGSTMTPSGGPWSSVANHAEQHHVDPSYRVPTPSNDDLLDHDVWLTVDDPDGQPLLLVVAPLRRRVRDAALLPHPRGQRRAQRRPLPREQRAGHRAGAARRALPARHRDAGRADQRAAALPADGGVPVRAGARCEVRLELRVDAHPVDDQLLREGQAVGHLAAEHAADREVEDQVERPVEGPVALRLDLVGG